MAGKTQPKQVSERERTLIEGVLYYLSYLFRHKYLIITITVLTALGSVVFAIVSLMLPPEKSPLPNFYVSYAVLIAGEGGDSDMGTMLAALGIQAPRNETNYGELGVRVLRSNPFIDTIVEENDIIKKYGITDTIRTSSRNIILGNSTFVYEPRTGSLRLSFESTDPHFARDVVNSMVNNLQKWFQQWEGSSSRQNLNAIEIKLEEVSQEIRRLEDEIARFQTEYGVFSIEQLAEAQTRIINDLENQLIRTEMAIKNYTGFSTLQDQELIQLQAQRDSLRELIQQIEQGQGSGVRRMPSRQELSTLAVEYSHLQMNHQIQMRIFQNLKEQYEVQKLTTTTESSPFSILEPAEVPEEKSRPRRSQICLIATVIGFFGSIGLALLIDLVRNVKNDPEKRKILKGE